jgi:hypothetical protein
MPRKILFRANGEGGMLLDVATGTMYGLTPTAAVAWAVLADGGDLAAAIAAVLETFAIDEDTARADLTALMIDLREHGLLEAAR